MGGLWGVLEGHGVEGSFLGEFWGFLRFFWGVYEVKIAGQGLGGDPAVVLRGFWGALGWERGIWGLFGGPTSPTPQKIINHPKINKPPQNAEPQKAPFVPQNLTQPSPYSLRLP